MCQTLPTEALEAPCSGGGEQEGTKKKGGVGGNKTLGERLSTAALSRLEEREAAAVPAAWDAALAALDKCPGWHLHSDPEKALLPRLRTALRAGAYGCGVDVYPKVLPLLAR